MPRSLDDIYRGKRAGKRCPKDGGSILGTDEYGDLSCIQCGFTIYTDKFAERIALEKEAINAFLEMQERELEQ